MNYIVHVTQVLHTGIHRRWIGRQNGIDQFEDLPLPNRLHIEQDGDPRQPCMLYRYTESGAFCGDSWHENLGAAFAQAEYEYGLLAGDWQIDNRESNKS